MNIDQNFLDEAQRLNFPVDAQVIVGGNYAPGLLQGDLLYISGQIPRVGNEVQCIGAVGEHIALEQAQRGCQICVLRALLIAQQLVGSLNKIQGIARVGVFVRSAPDFTQQSEVANGASDLLLNIFGEAGHHTRTSVGVLQLPKGAAVEVEFVFKVAAHSL